MGKIPTRKNHRLTEFDYSQNGAYFVTICTNKMQRILSAIRRGDPCGRPITDLTELGRIAANTINDIEERFNICIDKYVIMPNHIHMIVIIQDRATTRVAPTNKDSEGRKYTLGNIIGAYKSLITNKWLKICKSNNNIMKQIWQRSYYDHIIRNQLDYNRVWQYIDENPLKWELDEYYVK